MLKPRLLALLLLCFSSVSQAAMVWVPALTTNWGSVPGNTNFLTIESYRVYWNGGNAVLMLRFKSDGWVSTGCAASDNNKIMSYWQPSNVNAFHQALMTSVIEAMAQGKKVRVEYDNTVCDAEGGRMLYGIEPEPPV